MLVTMPSWDKRPLIAWGGGGGAGALNHFCSRVPAAGCEATVISFVQPHAPASSTVPQIVKHLACHGVTAKEDTLIVQDIGVMGVAAEPRLRSWLRLARGRRLR